MAFGYGQSPINFPISPLSTSLREMDHAQGVKTVTLGISVDFLPNIEGGGLGVLA